MARSEMLGNNFSYIATQLIDTENRGCRDTYITFSISIIFHDIDVRTVSLISVVRTRKLQN
jgi:hypothetical protein